MLSAKPVVTKGIQIPKTKPHLNIKGILCTERIQENQAGHEQEALRTGYKSTTYERGINKLPVPLWRGLEDNLKFKNLSLTIERDWVAGVNKQIEARALLTKCGMKNNVITIFEALPSQTEERIMVKPVVLKAILDFDQEMTEAI